MRVGLLQLNATDDPAGNLDVTRDLLSQAVSEGAEIVLTPEVTNCLCFDRPRQRDILRPEEQDPTLAALREAAKSHGVWVLIGSLALRTDDPDGRFANRSFLIDPEGRIAARYDKVHMFDVTVSDTESYRESAAYRPGTHATLTDTPWGKLGMTICYDLRFPTLYRDLAQAGARFLTVPSAFTATTGEAHWAVLLRARAIETGCWVIAPAQTGSHAVTEDRTLRTHGHSLVVSPWGEVVLDAGTEPGAYVVDIDPGAVEAARGRIPSIHATPTWTGP